MKGEGVPLSLLQMVDIFMDYCISKQLRPKMMKGYEQALRLFIRWVGELYGVDSVEKLKEAHTPRVIFISHSNGMVRLFAFLIWS